MIQLNTEEIKQILPHRPPMLLVDRIIDLVPFESGVGIKNVTLNEPFFPGHFPGNPIMPGVFILEAMAQVGGIAMLYPEENRGKIALFGGMENVKFKRQVIPGDQLIMKAHIVNIVKKNFGKLHADTYVDDKLAATADFIFALKKPENGPFSE
jgi:beta-hydroxyacyl-ACP dehydratase FabZ